MKNFTFSTQKCFFIGKLLNYRLIALVFVFGTMIVGGVWGQQTVFSRSDAGTGNWWDGANPWYYATWNNNQNRPDNNSGTRNFVKIGHNNNLTMTTNGAFFALNTLDLESGASSVRTINGGGANTGISLSGGIYNSSGATHVINADLGIDGSTIQLHNNSTGGMTFGGAIFINANTVQFGGSGSGNFTVTGVLQGSNGNLTKTGTNTLNINTAATYTGTTTINAGTLTLGVANALPVTSSAGIVRFAAGTPTFNLGLFNLGSSTAAAYSAGALDFDVNTTVNLGASGSNSYYFKASNGQTWDATTITINNWAGTAGVTGTRKIFIGSDVNGLTAAQLAKITFTGYGGAMLLSNGELVPASNYYSKSTASLDLSLTSSWGTNTDGSGTAPSNFTMTGVTYNIRNSATPTIGANWTVSGTGSKIIVGDGTNACNFTIGSTYVVTSTATDVSNNGTITSSSSSNQVFGTMNVLAGGTYVHNRNGGTVPSATWNASSICRITGVTTTFPSGITNSGAQTNMFGSFEWNCPNQSSQVNFAAGGSFWTSFTLEGNFTVNNTGSYELIIGSDAGTTTSRTFLVKGNFELANTGSKSELRLTEYQENVTLTVNGNVSISSGTLDMSSWSSSAGTGILNVKGNFTHTGGTITETGSSTSSTIAINGTTAQTIESTGRSNSVLFSVAQTTATGTCSVAAGKTFVNSGNTFTVTDNASTSSDITINGTFKRSSTDAVTFVSLTVANGGTYEHAISGASGIPTATWADGSTLLVSAAPSTGLSAVSQGQSFWNVTFNTTGSVTNDLDNSSFAVRNVFSMPSTTSTIFNLNSGTTNRTNAIATLNLEGGTFNMANSTGTSSITGNVNVSGGTFKMTSAASTPGAPTITGNVTVSGGAFYAVAAAAGAVTSTISGNLSVTGGTFYVTGNTGSTTHILDLNGTLDLSNTGVIEFNPVAAASGAGRVYVSGNVTVSGGTMQRTQTSSTGSTGIYFDGSTQTFTWSGGSISNAMPNRFYVNGVTTLNEVYSHGSSAQTTVNGTAVTPVVGSAWPTSINNLTINNTNGVTLSAAKTVGGTLTFTNGILTPNGNTLIVSNTATNAISGAGAGKYVSGPLKWNLSNSNGTYNFPVGKGGNYYPFSLTTTAASSPVITVESFNSDAGGSNGSTITSPSTTEYWSATLNSGTFTGSLSLTRPTSLTSDVIAQSSTQTGTYSSIGGTLSSPSVNNSNSISTLGFFKFATSAACSDPTTQATGLSFSSVGATGMTINWSGSGNGDGVIVVMKAGSAPTDPSDNIAYTANTTFGSGTDAGSSSFVVFNGAGSSVTVTGLSASTTYHVRVYSRSCSGASIKINTTSPLSGSQITLAPELAAHPGSFTSSASLGGQIDLTYSAANTITNAAGYIILQKTGASAPASAPTDAIAYSIGSTIGDGTVADIVTDLTETTSAITGLSSSTQYSYSIIPFSYNGSNSGTYNYYTAATIKTTTVTTIAAVTRYAVANGNWNSTSTWSTTSGGSSGASVPTGSDVVYLQGNYTVTVTANASCGTINFDDVGTLTVNSGVTLSGGAINLVHGDKTVSGTIAGAGTLTCTTVNVGTASPFSSLTRTTTLTSSISALTASGASTLTAKDYAGAKNNPTFNLQSGTFSTTGVTTVIPGAGGTATLNLASGVQSGTLTLTGLTPFTIDGDGTSTIILNGTGATVNYAASGAQTVRNTSYTNLTLSGSGNKTLAAFSISGTLSVEGSAVGITTAPTFGASSTLQYKNVGTRTTNAIEWPSSNGPANLIIDNSGSTVTMVSSANRTLSGNLTLTAGTLADNGNTLTLQGNIAGTATHSGAGSITMTGASKTISGATLGNLILNNASGFSLTGSPTVNGALTFTAGKLGIGANTLNLAGTVASMTSTNNITGSASSTISITGTGTLGTLMFDQTTNGSTNLLSALTINRSSTGVVNLGSALQLSGNLTVTNGSLRSSGANTLTMAGSTQTITISNTSGGSITGTDVGSGNDLTLTISNGSTTTFTGDATSTGDEDKKLFNVTVNSGGELILQRGILCKYGTFTVNGTLQINSGGYLQSTNGIAPTYGSSSNLIYNSGGTYTVGFEWTANATSGVGVPRNVTIGNGVNTTLSFGSSGQYRQANGNVLISASSGLTLSSAAGGGLKVGGNFTNNGTFTPDARTLELVGGGAQTISGTLNGVSTTNNIYYLTISNTSGGVSLSNPVVVTNTLNLNTGVVTTTSTNILHITNSAAAAMIGGSSASYVSGPLRWSVSNSGGGDYKFHLGKSSTYLPLNVNNPTGTSPIITAEAFASNAGGSAGSGLASISTAEYWSVVNSGTLSSATISLAKSNIGSNNGIGNSTSISGSYSSLGGTITNTLINSNTITAESTVGSLSSTNYFVLATKVAGASISSFSPSSGYVGTSITISGTNFTGATAVSIGGVAAASYTVNSATEITAVVASGGATGTISVTTPGGTATSISSFTFNGYISNAASDWNTSSTWLGGAIPPASAIVTIDNVVTVNGSVTNTPSTIIVNSTKSLTFGVSGALTVTTFTNNGSVVMTSGGTLNIASGGTFANGSNTFTGGSGKVSFVGSGSVTGTISFNNVDIAGGVNFGSASTINGTLSINSGGFINTNSPSYGVGSTLKYSTGGTFGRASEWSTTSGQGAPYSVQLSNSTTLNYPNTGNSGADLFSTNLSLAGDLTVDNGSALYMDWGGNANKSGRLDVTGNVLLNGNLSLGNASGGDIKVGGNWTRNSGSTLNTNGRAVFFTGSGNSTITGNGGETFTYMVNEKTGGSISLGNNLTLTAPNGGNALTHKSTASINLNNYDLTFSGPDNSNILADGACSITGTGNVLITSNAKNLTGQNTGSWTFGSNVNLKLQSGLNFGTNLSTVNGTLEISSGGFVSGNGRPSYGVGSTLKYNSTGAYGRNTEWLSGFSSGAGVPYNVLISAGTTLDPGANSNASYQSWVRNELTIDGTFDMSLTDQVEPINVLGNVTFNNGTLKLSTTAGGDLKLGGNWSGTGTFVANSRAVYINGTGNQSISRNDIFPFLIIDKASGTLTIAGNITLNNKLTYSGGSISFSGGSIDASGASAEVEFANSSSFTLPTGLFSNSVNKLTLNGTGGITLSENVTVTNSLKLTSGVITLGSRNLTLTGGLDATGNGNSSSYINTSGSGALIRSISTTGVDYKFPVGLSGYAPISVNFTGGTITSSSLASRAVSGLHPNATDGAYIRTNLYWEMNQTGMTNPQYNVSFTYPGVTNGTGSNETESNLLPAKWSASTGWLSSGSCSVCFNGTTMGTSSINTETKTITWNGVSGFSDFGGFGQGNGSPLPVELTSFSASCEEDVVTLSWSTASEQNSSHFDVEKSTDGENWRVIGTVLAAGNSTQEINYSFVDSEKFNGSSYYQLNQVDIDGKNKIYGPIQANCEAGNDILMSFPNPSNKSGFSVVLNTKNLEGNGILSISDSKGNIVYTKQVEVEKGISLWNITEPNLATGVYFIKISVENSTTQIIKHIQY